MRKGSVIYLFLIFGISFVCIAADWPQFQNNAQRTGRTSDSVAPPYRVRWIWLGVDNTIRNHLSVSTWTGPDIPSGTTIGNVATLPVSVPFGFVPSCVPIIAGGRVFVGDIDGRVYAISADDGRTLWWKEHPGGTIASGAYANGVVVFGSLHRYVRGYDANNGNILWEVPVKGGVVSAPVTNGTYVCAGSLGGHVYCININNGSVLWTSQDLGAQIVGGLAMDSDSVYVGCETMYFYALNLTNGQIRRQKKIQGQSFYMLWPVVYNNLVFVEAAPVPMIGSEYIGEDVMSGATSVDNEQDRWLQFLQGQGGFSQASPEWKHLHVLNVSDFSEPFQVPNGPFEGCGTPPTPPTVDNQGRVLSYFKTKYVYLGRNSAFGTNYSLDISGINLSTGRRVLINNGQRAENEWYTWETDNLYGMTVGGNYLYIRQNFRGMHCINLTNSNATVIQTQYRTIDGGTWYPDICFRGNYDNGERVPTSTCYDTHNNEGFGRYGPVISGGILCTTEEFCVAAYEHSP